MVTARKRFGQHFLEPVWAERLAQAIGPGPADTLIEIGPGRGALTFPLARRARQIVAVELDRDLVEWLRPRLPANVDVVSGDILRTPLDAMLPPGVDARQVRVVGNLPYNISSPVLFRLIELHRTAGAFVDAVVMLQREVADRLAAGPGTKAYGALSIAVQLHAEVSLVMALPPGAFRPAPAVSSAVVRLVFRPPAVRLADPVAFDRVVKGLFMHRRKTVANGLKALGLPAPAEPADLLAAAGIDPGRRPETLTLAELAALAEGIAAAPRATMV